MNSSSKQIKVLKRGGLKVSQEMIFIVLAMLRRLKTMDVDLPVRQPTLPVPLFADRLFFRPLTIRKTQKTFVKPEFQQKSEVSKGYLKKLPLPDKVQYLGLRSFKLAMCFGI